MDNDLSREKLVLLGSLMAGLAHEINTPLAAVRCNGDVLELAFQRLEEFLRALPEAKGRIDAPVEDVLAQIRDALHTNHLACERLAEITRGLRNFMRTDDAAWKKVPVDQILENALTLVAHELRGRITVVKDFGTVAEVDCHPSQLSQVFINILVNAAQAMAGPGEIRIRTWQDSGMVHVSISDTGPGIAPEVLSHIFEPGLTTKERDLGTGLGLSISLKTVQNHRGRIDVQSQPGQGSTFVVVLPVVQISERKTNGEA